jgi:hypothetical protein
MNKDQAASRRGKREGATTALGKEKEQLTDE